MPAPIFEVPGSNGCEIFSVPASEDTKLVAQKKAKPSLFQRLVKFVTKFFRNLFNIVEIPEEYKNLSADDVQKRILKLEERTQERREEISKIREEGKSTELLWNLQEDENKKLAKLKKIREKANNNSIFF